MFIVPRTIHAANNGELFRHFTIWMNRIDFVGVSDKEWVEVFELNIKSGVQRANERYFQEQAKETDKVLISSKKFFKNVCPSPLNQRFADPEEVTRLVTYVASLQSSATNSAALHVDGGALNPII